MPKIKSPTRKICRTCKKIFFVIKYRTNIAKFCSHKCQGKAIFFKNMGKRMKKIHQGKSKSIEWKKKASMAKMAEKNPSWKGNNAGLDAIHIWIIKRFPKPKRCQCCKKVPPIDLANISQKYKRILSDWEWLCRRCHMIKDGRLKKLLHK